MAKSNTTRGWTIEAKLAYYFDVSECGCWIWKGTKTNKGYGKIFVGGKIRYAKNVAWEVYRGAIPAGLHVLHNCPGGDNPACMNPIHMWIGTKTENAADRDAKGRQAKGEACRTTVLTGEQVLEIRKDGRRLREIAADYNVAISTVFAIRARKSWKHLSP